MGEDYLDDGEPSGRLKYSYNRKVGYSPAAAAAVAAALFWLG